MFTAVVRPRPTKEISHKESEVPEANNQRLELVDKVREAKVQ
jgi:hypothetical protein